MDCPEFVRLIDDYLAHKLSKKKRQLMENHLNSCTTCSAYFLEEDPLLDQLLVNDWYQLEPPLDLSLEVLRRLEKEDKRAFWSPSKVKFLIFTWLSYFTMALLGFLSYILSRLVILRTIFSLGRSISLAFSQLSINPLVIFLTHLLVLSFTLIYYFLTRENKEEKII